MSFASQGDLAEKTVPFAGLAEGVYAYPAEGDPNSGVIVGDAGVMVVDATATPVMAQALLEQIRKVTDKPVTHVLLTHYHAVRVMGASAFQPREIIASAATRELMAGDATAGHVALVLGEAAALAAIFAPLTVRLYRGRE